MTLAIPTHGVPRDLILDELKALGRDDADWRRGRCFSLVYSAGDEHLELLKRASETFFVENGLNPMAFKSLKRMEAEVVRMTASLLHGDAQACGTMTSGGTESLLLAVKTARDRARKERPWILRPEMVLPASAHVGFDKAAHYFGVRIRRVPLDKDFRVDLKRYAKAINRNTVLLVASAPQYPQGVVDPIREIGAIAKRKKIPFHVDACVGGFILPFLEKLGVNVPTWDFRVDGVTSISADLHKFGYAAKGASVIVHRSIENLRHQFFIETDWLGGIYASPSLPGTRPGGPIAAAWACLRSLGEDGYLELARKALSAADRLRDGINQIDGIELLGLRHSTIVTWGAGMEGRSSRPPAVDVYAVADQLEARGWHVDRQQHPACVHLTVMAQHANGTIVDDYLRDLRDAVAYVRAHPEVKSQGNAAMYGMMAKVPFRGMVKSAVQKIIEDMYGPNAATQGAPDLSKPPVSGVVGKILDKHGPQVMALLDRVDDARKFIARM